MFVSMICLLYGMLIRLRNDIAVSSVADPDPGSGIRDPGLGAF